MELAEQAEPEARWLHASFRIGRYMYIWGGDGCRTDVVERLNLSTFTYEQRHLTNSSAPDVLDSMAVTWDESHGYTFGGRDGNRKRLNSIYYLDVSTLECIEIVPATGSDTPTPRDDCGMVHFNRKLVVYGGRTDDDISSDLLLFDLDNKTWSVQATTGEKPPGLYAYTFNMIDSHRASLFGGSDDGGRYHNDTYLLDLTTWHWTKVQIKGKKPAPRYWHATLCIEDPHTGHHPLLMVVGGVGSSVLSDVWLLEVINGVWTELSLPTVITERRGHTAVLFGTGVDFRVVVLFGGWNNKSYYISETTLLLLSQKGRSWVVDRVVGPADWMTPDDTLREQMERLQIYGTTVVKPRNQRGPGGGPLGPRGTTVVKPRNQRGPGGGPLGPRGATLADSPGIAILVTCDYKAISALSTLDGTNNDAKEIKKTFDFFNYIVFQLQNEQACKKDIEALLKEVSEDLSKYQGETENKVIMFAFSGHGTNEDEAEQIFAYDGQTLDIKEEIVLPLTRHKAVAYIPKLFFIDACRGEMSLVSKVAGAADTTKSASDQQYFEKGVQHVEGNYRIDYATIPEHVSYANSAGSIWLPVLARALREENDSFQNIADNVKKQVHQQLGNKKQQCESVNRLNTGALYLQK